MSELNAAEIKTLYESNANTNEFTDAEKTAVINLIAGRIPGLPGRPDVPGDLILQTTLWDPNDGVFPSGGSAGFVYRVENAGIIDGESFDMGDLLVQLVNLASSTTFANSWSRIEGEGVHSWGGLNGVVDDREITTHLRRLGFETEREIDYPVLVARDMPNATAAQALIDNSEGGNSGLWIVEEDQTASSNRSDATFTAVTDDILDLNDEVVPTTATASSTIELRAGTIVRVFTAKDFRVVSYPSNMTRESVRDIVGTALVAGDNITITVDDNNDTITINSTGGGASTAAEVSVANTGLNGIINSSGNVQNSTSKT